MEYKHKTKPQYNSKQQVYILNTSHIIQREAEHYSEMNLKLLYKLSLVY